MYRGARGIGAECALRVARRTGARLLLLGRSAPENQEVAATLERAKAKGITAVFRSADVTDLDQLGGAVRDTEAETGPTDITDVQFVSAINRKVDDYLNFAGDEAAEAATRAWLDDPLPVKIMVSNLDGVPYRVHFTSAATASGAPISHCMALHEDYMAF